MHRSISCSLTALFLLSGCGAKPTEKKETTKAEVVSQAPTGPAKTVAPVEEVKPTKKLAAPKKAAPKEDKKLTSSERQQYMKALNEGRTAHRAKDFTAAISAFDKALALFPDDPRALSEKGWSEFQSKDLKAAASDTNNAIGRTTDNGLLGSSYYNLGRILEEQQKTKEAIEAYQESLKTRPGNKIVKDRLTSLNASLIEKGSLSGPLLTFAGPFASDVALCKEATRTDDSSMKFRCDLTAADPAEEIKSIKGSGALLSAKVFTTQSGYAGEPGSELMFYMETYYNLAIQTADGWYLLANTEYVYNPGAFGISASLTIDQFEIKDLVPGGAPELLLVSSLDRSDSDMGINELTSESTTTVLICGVGASKKPSCAKITVKSASERGILLEEEEATMKTDNPDFKHEGFYKNAWSLDWSFTADGKLQLRGTSTKGISAETKALIGTHKLLFE
jgi:tetratricopeptide (TPR) repeat protein